MMALETVNDVSGAVSALVALIGFGAVVYQLREMQRAARISAMASIYAQAGQWRENVAEHQEVRPFLLEGAPITEDDPNFNRVKTLAEVQLNYLEQLSLYAEMLPKPERSAWGRFIERAFVRSPVARSLYADDPGVYSPSLRPFAAVGSAG